MTPPLSPSRKLYSARAITIGSFFGGPLAATVLIGNNFRAFGDQRRQRLTYLLGLTLSVGLAWLLINLPEQALSRTPNVVFASLIASIVYLLTEKLQGSVLREHFASNGQRASGWAAFGWSVLSLVLYLAIAVGLAWNLPPYDFEKSTYTHGLQGNEIYHNAAVDTQTLAELGDYLLKSGYFEPQQPGLIQLTKTESGFVLHFPSDRSTWNDNETLDTFLVFGQAIGAELGLDPISIELVDADLQRTYRKSFP